MVEKFPTAMQLDVQPPKPSQLALTLTVQDREVVEALLEHAEGSERNAFALRALRLGVLALRQAQGAIDQAAVQQVADRMIADVKNLVESYFDPQSGRLIGRLNGLINDDGELSRLLKQHLDGETCTLAQTLAHRIGENSPLMKILSPEHKTGLIATIEQRVRELLTQEGGAIIKQFSLDDPASALSRLLHNIRTTNGELREDLSKDLHKITEEFSKDKEDSLICKLLHQMDETHETVRNSLTLDAPESPLSVLRGELNTTIENLLDKNAQFHTDVLALLGADKARKEAPRGTYHGIEFEEAVGVWLKKKCSELSDQYEATSKVGGRLGSKRWVGDHVITLGHESAAAGERIAVECKEDASYTEAKALAELEQARKNREAQIGVFIFSKVTAPAGQPPFARRGNDILVVWDREDAFTDVYLEAGISVARALVVRQRASAEETGEDLAQIEKSILAVEKLIDKVGQIKTWATTIRNNGDNIIKDAEKIAECLREQVNALSQSVRRLKSGSDKTQSGAVVEQDHATDPQESFTPRDGDIPF